MTGAASAEGREGFSLVEAIVAILLLTIVLTALAAHLYGVARQNLIVANDGYRNAVITQELGRLSVLPYDKLQDESEVAIATPPFPHRRRVEVVQIDTRTKEVRLIIEQTTPVRRTDTMTVLRTQMVVGNPFKTN